MFLWRAKEEYYHSTLFGEDIHLMANNTFRLCSVAVIILYRIPFSAISLLSILIYSDALLR